MKEHKYSTIEICRIFDITRETLRHYERLGLLNPSVNTENGYREYSYWDVSTLIDILKYRSLGFSLSDAKEALYESDFPRIIESLAEHADYYTNKIIEYTLLRKKALKDLTSIRLVQDHLFEISEVETEDLFFVPYTTDPKNPYFESMREAFNNSQFFTTSLIVDKDTQGDGNYGLITEKQYADFLNMDNGITIPGAKVVAQMVDLVGRERINESFLFEFMDRITQMYSRPFDKVYSILVSRFYDKEKRYHHYFFVFSKLE